MDLSGIIGALDGVKARVQDRYRRGIQAAAIALCGGLFILGALGFAVAAGYIWLSMEMPAHQAALVTAGVLFLAGCVVFAVARGRNRAPQRPAAGDTTSDLAAQADDAAREAFRGVVSQVQGSPLSTVATAVALGAVVGLLRPTDDT